MTQQFSIVTKKDFTLPIIPFDPKVELGEGWEFESETNGIGDGVTGLGETIVKAHELYQSGKKEEAMNLLFLTGLKEDQTAVTGEDRIKALKDRILADPVLFWSLVKQEGQTILRWLYDTFKVAWMEALRRPLRDPNRNRFALYLCRDVGGSWA
ncbi:MAG: hypothetical protein WCO09_04745 [bacterium]